MNALTPVDGVCRVPATERASIHVQTVQRNAAGEVQIDFTVRRAVYTTIRLRLPAPQARELWAQLSKVL